MGTGLARKARPVTPTGPSLRLSRGSGVLARATRAYWSPKARLLGRRDSRGSDFSEDRWRSAAATCAPLCAARDSAEGFMGGMGGPMGDEEGPAPGRAHGATRSVAGGKKRLPP